MDTILLRTNNLSKSFGGIEANKSISITIEKGKITALIGPNGSGKTTFINLVSGLLRPTTGTIVFEDVDITNLEPHVRALMGIARTFQRIRLFESLNVLENVVIARKKFIACGFLDVIFHTHKFRASEEHTYEAAYNLLEKLNLSSDIDRKPSELPYGKRRLLEIARALALEPKLLMLDEPAAGMTQLEYSELARVLRELVSQGITILLVEHTMDFVKDVADKVYVLSFGQVIAQGTFDEIQHDPAVISAYLGEEVVT